MAIGEAITNIAAADIALDRVKLSANWMAACGQPGEDAKLFDAVQAASAVCQALGISVPVGKDSLSMKTAWRDGDVDKTVAAPVSLIASAAAPVDDVRRSLTPQLVADTETLLVLVDLGAGRNRMGGSILAQVTQQIGNEAPDLDDPSRLRAFVSALRALDQAGRVLAYHDRSDGGLYATLVEMAFAGHVGISGQPRRAGGRSGRGRLGRLQDPARAGRCPPQRTDPEGAVRGGTRRGAADPRRRQERGDGRPAGGGTRRGEPDHRQAEHEGRRRVLVRCEAGVLAPARRTAEDLDRDVVAHRAPARQPGVRRPGVRAGERSRTIAACRWRWPSIRPTDVAAPFIASGARPRMAILREQGVNSQTEMAYAFHRAGFAAVDVHMTDLIDGRATLADFKGFVACGGFSYGDVLGAGGGWAKTILHNPALADMFAAFFGRGDAFALGVCNGCQMMSHLRVMIPGARHWPRFERNASEQFEGRLVQVEVAESPSLFFAGMAGSRAPIANAHGEGRVVFDSAAQQAAALVAMRYVDSHGRATADLPVQPERLAGRHHGRHHARRPLHDRDAAPGARLPGGPDVMAAARPRRGLAVDADVPQRTALGRLTGSS